MGKIIKKISLWSWKSLVSFYGKAATLLFAVICVASGLTVKSASAGVSGVATKAVKGKTLFSSDSTVLKNIKLYLCEVLQPVYGMGATVYKKVDSTTSTNIGSFEMKCPLNISRFAVQTADKVVHGANNSVFVSDIIYYPDEKDTSFTLYMSPYIPTSVKNMLKPASQTQLDINQGGSISIKIPELIGDKRSASVTNLAGETVTTLYPSSDGTIKWNTESVAKGIYFLSILNNNNPINMRISVQ